jgi:hypothetical protein
MPAWYIYTCAVCSYRRERYRNVQRCPRCGGALKREEAMETVLQFTLTTTDGPPTPDLIADAERIFNTALTVDGAVAVGEVRLAEGRTMDDLKAALEAIPGVTITRDEIVDA